MGILKKTLRENRDELGRIGDGIQEMGLNLARLYGKQEELFLETILSLAEAIDARDPYTRGHSDRVSQYALKTARGLGLSEKRKPGNLLCGHPP